MNRNYNDKMMFLENMSQTTNQTAANYVVA